MKVDTAKEIKALVQFPSQEEAVDAALRVVMHRFVERRLVDGVFRMVNVYVDVGRVWAPCPACHGSGAIPRGALELDTEERDGKTLIKKAWLRQLPGPRGRLCGTCWTRGWVELDKEGKMLREMFDGDPVARSMVARKRGRR